MVSSLPSWPTFDPTQVNGYIAEHEAFLDNGLAAQRALPKHQAMAITAAAILDHKGSLERSCNPIVNKPKPLPEVKKEQPPADVPPATDASTSTPGAEPAAEPATPTGGDLD